MNGRSNKRQDSEAEHVCICAEAAPVYLPLALFFVFVS